MTTVGVVAVWHADKGWGVIESPNIPSECWFHFSSLWTLAHPPLHNGESISAMGQGAQAVVGETVDFEWEHARQDGYLIRAVDVRPRRQPPRRTFEFTIHGEYVPWPIERFGEIPYPGIWTEGPLR